MELNSFDASGNRLEQLTEASDGVAPAQKHHGLRKNLGQVVLHIALASSIGVVLRLVILPEALSARKRAQSHGKGGDEVDFLMWFGVSKALSGLCAGHLVGILGRRRTFLLGWSLGVALIPSLVLGISFDIPVALSLANCFLGMHQGIAWATNIICLMDLLGPGQSGLASGLSNAAGYLGSAVAAPPVAAIFQRAGFESGVVHALNIVVVGGYLLTWRMVETEPWVQAELAAATAATVVVRGGGRGQNAGLQRAATFAGCGGALPAMYALAGLTVNAATGLVWGALVLWCQERAGLSAVEIGWVESVHTTSKVAAMVLAGVLADRCLSARRLVLAALGCLACGLLLLVQQAGQALSWPLLCSASGLIGVGVGAAFPALAAAVAAEAATPTRRAAAYGAYRMWRDAGYALGGLAPRLFDTFQSTASAALVWSLAVVGLAALLEAHLRRSSAAPPAAGGATPHCGAATGQGDEGAEEYRSLS